MPYYPPDFTGPAFGNQQGKAVLIIMPLATAPNRWSSEEALEAARAWLMGERETYGNIAFMGWINSKYIPDAPADWAGVLGRGEDLSILLRWQKSLSVIDALREVEQAEGGLPAWLCAALQAASYAIDRGVDPLLAASAVYYSARACAFYPKSNNIGFLSRKDLERLVDATPLSDLLRREIPALSSGTDYARFSMLLGNRLLDQKWYGPRRASLSENELSQLTPFAAGHLCLDPQPKIQLAYVPLRIRWSPGRKADEEKYLQISSTHLIMGFAFALYDYFVQCAPPPPVLRAFFPGGDVDAASFHQAVNLMDLLHADDHPSAVHLAKSLLEEADQKASYAPQGMYRVRLPKGIPIADRGIGELNIFFDGSEMWVQFLLPEPCPGILRWSAKDFQKYPDEFPNVLSLTLAAIWHDFRVTAEHSFPQEAIAQSLPPPSGEFPSSSTTPSHRSIGASVRVLPVSHGGRRVWGYQYEREYLARRPHLVGAFRRHLPEDQHRREDALSLAADFGIILPDEHFTIVQPHARGGRTVKAPTSDNAPVVRSRGLAVAFAYGKFLEESGNNNPDNVPPEGQNQ